MKFTKTFFPISILTFFVGCLAVWSIGLKPNLKEVPSNSSLSINDPQTITPVNPIPAAIPESKPRFTFTTTSIWGYTNWQQLYETNDGQHVIQVSRFFGTPKESRLKLKKKIKEAVQIVEHIPNYKGIDKVMVERVIVINPPDKNGKETASILLYDGGQFISSINAPSLELALEFESFFEQNRLADIKAVP